MSNAGVKIVEGWVERPLSDMADYFNGLAFRPTDWVGDGTKIIRIEQLNNPTGQYDFFGGQVPHHAAIEDGDLIFSWSATLKAIIWNHGPGVLNQHLFKVVARPDVDKLFLRYLIENSIEDLAGSSQGSTMRHIKRSELKKFRPRVPASKDEQCRIAEVLFTIDSLIEKTEAMIAKLQFEFEGILADQFSAFKNWEEMALGDRLSVPPKNGFSPNEVDNYTGTQVLGLGCLTPSGYLPIQIKDIPTGLKKAEGAVLNDGDLLVSRSNTRELVGLPGIFRKRNEITIYPDLMIRLVAGAKTSNDFLELVLRWNMVRRQIVSNAVGTSGSMVKTSSDRLCKTRIWLPQKDEQTTILMNLSLVRRRMEVEKRNLEKTRSVKAGLMQDLLSGVVTVPE